MTESEVLMVRVYMHERESRLREIMHVLHDEERVRGLTAFRGVAGFGTSGQWLTAGLVDLSLDLPYVMEFFDEPGRARAAVARLTALCKPGHVVTWPARMPLR